MCPAEIHCHCHRHRCSVWGPLRQVAGT